MEKKRRARINNCLNELKTLILDAMKKDVSILRLCMREHDGHVIVMTDNVRISIIDIVQR